MKKMNFVLAACLVAVAGGAVAGRPTATVIASGASEKQTNAYAGLAWTLGAKKSPMVPEVVVGVRSLTVNSSNRVNKGVDLSARFAFNNGLTLDSTRLSYVGGKRDMLGAVGIGYSYANKSFLTTLAAQGSYARLGLDYELANGNFLPYFDLLTVKQPKKVNPGLVCSNPNYPVPDNAQVESPCIPVG